MVKVQRSLNGTDNHSIIMIENTYIKIRTIKLIKTNLMVSCDNSDEKDNVH